jgi:hypothetical protein
MRDLNFELHFSTDLIASTVIDELSLLSGPSLRGSVTICGCWNMSAIDELSVSM